MRSRPPALVIGGLVFASFAQMAQGGVVRSAGKKVVAGADNATQVAAASGAALAGGTTSAGHTAANALKSGLNSTESGVAVTAGDAAAAGSVAGSTVKSATSTAGQAVKSASSKTLSETSAGARKLWHVIW